MNNFMNFFYRIYLKLEAMISKQQVNYLKSRLKRCGNHVILHPKCEIVVPERLEIGDHTSIWAYTTIYSTFGVKIGKNCLISSNCGISSYNHTINSLNRIESRKDDYLYSKQVIIGDNVWIGMNACILPGVEIGENSIVGSGSVVTKNVPANEIWVGNPAKFIKSISYNE
jgi:acetyltransferase-like isoleucine patch superfamily enzyme